MASHAGFWGDSPNAYQLLSKKSPNRYHLNRMIRRQPELANVLDKLLADSTPASSTSLTRKRIAAARDLNQNVQGGVRTIETLIPVGSTLDSGVYDSAANTQRAVTAADVTNLRDVNVTYTYPVDKSGNGGGGKRGGGI